MKSLSRVRLVATPWTAAYQAPLSMGFSRQEYWSGLPLPSPIFDLYRPLIQSGLCRIYIWCNWYYYLLGFFFFLIQLLKQKGFNLKYEENVILNFDTLTFIIYSVLGF